MEAPAAEPAPLVTPPAANQAAAPAAEAEAPAPEAKRRLKASAPPRRPVAARAEPAPENLRRKDAERQFAPPPPPRPALHRERAALEDDALGGLSGAASGVEQRKAEEAPGGGAGAGYLGGRKTETAADKKQVQSEGAAGPSRDLAKKPAPATVRSAPPPPAVATPAAPPPAPAPRPAEKEAQQAPRGRAAAPAQAQAPADGESLDEYSRPAKAKARKGDDNSWALQDKVEKANLAFTAGRWEEAAAAYRELLRLYPDNKAVPAWKGRLRACEQAQQVQSR
jgi:hypothetical protein